MLGKIAGILIFLGSMTPALAIPYQAPTNCHEAQTDLLNSLKTVEYVMKQELTPSRNRASDREKYFTFAYLIRLSSEKLMTDITRLCGSREALRFFFDLQDWAEGYENLGRY